MASTPAFSFYAKDWISATLTWALDARGAYISLLAYQWDTGSVPGDKPAALARVLGVNALKARAVWALVSHKFSRRADGTWINERLEVERTKQTARAAALRDNGSKGGRPKNQKDNQTETNRLSTDKPNGNLNESLSSSSSSSGTSLKNNEVNARDARFDAWWSAYPKKTGKGAAFKAWIKIRPTDAIVAQMHTTLSWQRNQPGWVEDHGKYVPNPATYLNQARWEDEPFFTETTDTRAEDTRRMIAEREAMAGK